MKKEKKQKTKKKDKEETRAPDTYSYNYIHNMSEDYLFNRVLHPTREAVAATESASERFRWLEQSIHVV